MLAGSGGLRARRAPSAAKNRGRAGHAGASPTYDTACDPGLSRTLAGTTQYLHKNSLYIHYAQFLAEGLPIATGVIEGACRHLVQDRMGITGARWGLAVAEAVLKLRAIRTSRDWDE